MILTMIMWDNVHKRNKESIKGMKWQHHCWADWWFFWLQREFIHHRVAPLGPCDQYISCLPQNRRARWPLHPPFHSRRGQLFSLETVAVRAWHKTKLTVPTRAHSSPETRNPRLRKQACRDKRGKWGEGLRVCRNQESGKTGRKTCRPSVRAAYLYHLGVKTYLNTNQ